MRMYRLEKKPLSMEQFFELLRKHTQKKDAARRAVKKPKRIETIEDLVHAAYHSEN